MRIDVHGLIVWVFRSVTIDAITFEICWFHVFVSAKLSIITTNDVSFRRNVHLSSLFPEIRHECLKIRSELDKQLNGDEHSDGQLPANLLTRWPVFLSRDQQSRGDNQRWRESCLSSCHYADGAESANYSRTTPCDGSNDPFPSADTSAIFATCYYLRVILGTQWS